MNSYLRSFLVLAVSSYCVATSCGNFEHHSHTTRHYCIAVVDKLWDYAKASTTEEDFDDASTGEPVADLTGYGGGVYEEMARRSIKAERGTLGKQAYKGLLYKFSYDNVTDSCDWTGSPNGHHGLLGPTIRAITGDTIIVHFYNNADSLYDTSEFDTWYDDWDDDVLLSRATNATFNLVPEGLEYDKKTEAAFAEEVVYTWTVPSDVIPSGHSSTILSYGSDAYSTYDHDTGVFGAIVVVNKHYVKDTDDVKPCDVDDEIVLCLTEISETNSAYYEYNVFTQFGAHEGDRENPREMEEIAFNNFKYSFNGHSWGNLNAERGLRFSQYEKVRWYMIIFASTRPVFEYDDANYEPEGPGGPGNGAGEGEAGVFDDLTVYFRGNVLDGGTRAVSEVTVSSSQSVVVDMTAAVPGTHLLAVEGFEAYGMLATYTVEEDGLIADPDAGDDAGDDAGVDSSSSGHHHHDSTGMSKGGVAALSVCLTLVAVVAVAFLVMAMDGKGVVRRYVAGPICLDGMDNSSTELAPGDSSANI